MIRYVYIGDQITDGSEEFAFYDTVNDKFMEFSGNQVFDTLDMFEEYGVNEPYYERCLRLIPKDKLSKNFSTDR